MTLTGADALGFGGELGSLDVGKRAAIIVVTLPDALTDVEEYLLSGIAPADVVPFFAAQLTGAVLAWAAWRFLMPPMSVRS